MAELLSPAGELPYIPDNLTLAQFILDSQHPSRPIRKHGIPWFIEDDTGRTLGYEEVRTRLLFSIDICSRLHRDCRVHSDTCASFRFSKRIETDFWH
jgi:prophage antirepressor-like protein